MSEYIAVSSDLLESVDKRQLETIVRCRNCKHFFDWAYDQSMCDNWGNDGKYPIVEPYGFCAWGEER